MVDPEAFKNMNAKQLDEYTKFIINLNLGIIIAPFVAFALVGIYLLFK